MAGHSGFELPPPRHFKQFNPKYYRMDARIDMKSPNKANAAKPAVASGFQIGAQWRGSADSRRSVKFHV